MTKPCGCCEGTEELALAPAPNRPGLDALAYRLGRHADFLEAMLARLSSHSLTVDTETFDQEGRPIVEKLWPLKGLRTRDRGDPAIALLDAWAVLADVLTFYQERIANEGYLRTATERRSILELARLVGYRLRPGVTSSVYLAFTLEDGYRVEIPAGTRVQSVPVGDQKPQPFETAEPIQARAEWNAIKPRTSRPQYIARIAPGIAGTAAAGFGGVDTVSVRSFYLAGTSTGLGPNDALVFDFRDGNTPVLALVESVDAQAAADRTLVTLQWPAGGVTAAPTAAAVPTPRREYGPGNVLDEIGKPLPQQPRSGSSLGRTPEQAYTARSGLAGRFIAALRPEVGAQLYKAWANTVVTEPLELDVYALRVKARVFGHNAQLRRILNERNQLIRQEEWPLDGTMTLSLALGGDSSDVAISAEQPDGSSSLSMPLHDEQNNPWTVEVLPGLTLEYRLETDVDVGILAYHFTWPELKRTISIKPIQHSLALDFVFAWDPLSAEKHLEPGQAVSFKMGPSRLSVGLTKNAELSIVDESPLPPDPCDVIDLDNEYDTIVPNTYAAVLRPGRPWLVSTARAVDTVGRADYDLTGTVTRLTLADEWLTNDDLLLSDIRGTRVLAHSEKLALAEEPIYDEVCGDTIELAALREELDSGQWVIVSGERSDIPNTPGVIASELGMFASVEEQAGTVAAGAPGQDVPVPGDTLHTVIHLATPLAYCYKRDTVTVYGNVARATHGETRSEVLGSGDAGQSLQSFDLRQFPVTYVSAPTASGIESTLAVYVNDVRWHEAESLVESGAASRDYFTRTDDESRTEVVFGDGEHGARLPTGDENVRAVYRMGIGKPGNVGAGQISTLLTRPLGVKSVSGPLPATGGADPESRDQARHNVPLALKALDRLVSVADYEDFARTFAGIGKAAAARLSTGARGVVHVTIAGEDDIPISETSDLYRNLRLAFRRYGEPHLPVVIAVRELLMLVISARVRLHPDYLWEVVEPKIRAALLDRFSFQRRRLGRGAAASEAIATIQQVEGVAYVDLDLFDAVSEADTYDLAVLQQKMETLGAQAGLGQDQGVPARLAVAEGGELKAAQLAVLSPAIPDTLILTELPS